MKSNENFLKKKIKSENLENHRTRNTPIVYSAVYILFYNLFYKYMKAFPLLYSL